MEEDMIMKLNSAEPENIANKENVEFQTLVILMLAAQEMDAVIFLHIQISKRIVGRKVSSKLGTVLTYFQQSLFQRMCVKWF